MTRACALTYDTLHDDMKYLAYHFSLTPPDEMAADVLTYLLGEVGFDSFEPADEGFKAYIKEELWQEEKLHEALSQFPLPGVAVSYKPSDFEEKNWNEAWEAAWDEPISITDDVVVFPANTAKAVPDVRHRIALIPHCSFGTGGHATTALLLDDLSRLSLSGAQVLDMGCGTGILSVMACMRGAEACTAIDIDEWSVESTRQNAALNGIDNIAVLHGDIAEVEGCGMFDLILANIHRNILIAHMPVYARHLARGGRLYLSGFYADDVAALRHAIEAEGLTYIDHRTRDEWCRILAVKAE